MDHERECVRISRIGDSQTQRWNSAKAPGSVPAPSPESADGMSSNSTGWRARTPAFTTGAPYVYLHELRRRVAPISGRQYMRNCEW
eukprot:scaffold262175_cov27-Tisochrysis_lutea.AAC.3